MNNNQHLCPVDGTPLIKIVKNGIEIEYCPTCGGVWLDHGELEKLIEMASVQAQPKFGPPNLDTNKHQSQPNIPQQYPNHGYSDHGTYGNKKHKKESWLGELFDF
jgi:uncharacterized protein